jgi:hypothetical protein
MLSSVFILLVDSRAKLILHYARAKLSKKDHQPKQNLNQLEKETISKKNIISLQANELSKPKKLKM